MNSDGTLTALSKSPFGTGTTPVDVTIDPSGGFIYAVTSGDSKVSIFSIDSSGTVRAQGTIAAGAKPVSLVATQ